MNNQNSENQWVSHPVFLTYRISSPVLLLITNRTIFSSINKILDPLGLLSSCKAIFFLFWDCEKAFSTCINIMNTGQRSSKEEFPPKSFQSPTYTKYQLETGVWYLLDTPCPTILQIRLIDDVTVTKIRQGKTDTQQLPLDCKYYKIGRRFVFPLILIVYILKSFYNADYFSLFSFIYSSWDTFLFKL